MTTTVALIVPKATLQSGGFTSRSVNTIQIWPAQSGYRTSPEPTNGNVARQADCNVIDAGANDQGHSTGYLWGWSARLFVPHGRAEGRSPGQPVRRAPHEGRCKLGPALGMTSAQVAALPFKSSDLAIVVSMVYPWDGGVRGAKRPYALLSVS